MSPTSSALIPDEVLFSVSPLIAEALDAFSIDARYGAAIIEAGRKAATRKTRLPKSKVEVISIIAAA